MTDPHATAALADLDRAVKSVRLQVRQQPKWWTGVETPDLHLTGRDLVLMALLRFGQDRAQAAGEDE